MNTITSKSMFDFCDMSKYRHHLNLLEEMILPERWNFSHPIDDAGNTKNPILSNYIKHMFKRVAQLDFAGNKDVVSISDDKRYICFNTNLYTKQYEFVCCVMERPCKTNKKWHLVGFFQESAPELFCFSRLPAKVSFFESVQDLIYDPDIPLRCNTAHILGDPENIERLPLEIREAENLSILFEGALSLVQKKVKANYKIAVPQYYKESLQFLLPICLSAGADKVDVVLAVSRFPQFYRGNTCLTLDMAYNNARLIAKPESSWLRI